MCPQSGYPIQLDGKVAHIYVALIWIAMYLYWCYFFISRYLNGWGIAFNDLERVINTTLIMGKKTVSLFSPLFKIPSIMYSWLHRLNLLWHGDSQSPLSVQTHLSLLR